MDNTTPQQTIRSVMELCADCDTCRTLMEEDCLFFPRLYRLWDREKDGGIAVTDAELREIVNLCTLCGLCPCPNIPAQLMKAKSSYVKQEGLPLAVRLLADVPRIARLCGSFPRIANALNNNGALAPLLRKVTRLHRERQLPSFPKENLFQWAAAKGLTGRKEGAGNVAYFAGCSAGYLFPEVGRAVVEVLGRNGVNVYLPPQNCCGMPHLVEGDQPAALLRARSNMDSLLLALEAGDDLVSSCPTCGFLMKVLLKDRAHYSEAYQRSVNADENEIKVPNPRHAVAGFHHRKKSAYRGILQDDGYFASLPPVPRIELAQHLFDAGEYLAKLLSQGRFSTDFKANDKRMVYFAPCHQREQQIGLPYLELLALIPGIKVESVGEGSCCGMGGNFGLKAEFHDKSLAIGQALMEKIRELAPQAIVTDCMSCRLQFRHALPYPVFHPMEILAKAYRENGSGVGAKES
jgi:glycerol-3-phosphate dehydrogenase subunit C